MQNIEKANLILLTNDLIAGQTNNVGYMNSSQTSMTWRNINLRALLGAMYDKYETFNLCLNNITTGVIGTENVIEYSYYITISGLPFLNNTYSVKLQSNTSNAILCTYVLPNLNDIQNTQYVNEILTFSKHQETATITLEYRAIENNSLPIIDTEFPQAVFSFSIYGVEKVQNQRM